MPDFWLYGDMELTDDQKALLDVPTGADKTIFPPKAPAATRDRGLLWENGIIPYVFDCSLRKLKSVLRHIYTSEFIIPVVCIDYDVHSGKYQRSTGYQVSVLPWARGKISWEDAHRVFLAGCRNPA